MRSSGRPATVRAVTDASGGEKPPRNVIAQAYDLDEVSRAITRQTLGAAASGEAIRSLAAVNARIGEQLQAQYAAAGVFEQLQAHIRELTRPVYEAMAFREHLAAISESLFESNRRVIEAYNSAFLTGEWIKQLQESLAPSAELIASVQASLGQQLTIRASAAALAGAYTVPPAIPDRLVAQELFASDDPSPEARQTVLLWLWRSHLLVLFVWTLLVLNEPEDIERWLEWFGALSVILVAAAAQD